MSSSHSKAMTSRAVHAVGFTEATLLPERSAGEACRARVFQLVMVPRLQNVDAIAVNAVHEPILRGDSSAPDIRTDMFQRFGLSFAVKRIAARGFDQFNAAQRDLAVGFDPIPKVLQRLGLKLERPLPALGFPQRCPARSGRAGQRAHP